MRFSSRGWPLSRDAVEGIVDRMRSMWEEHGFGPWAAVDRSSGRWLGRIGLSTVHLGYQAGAATPHGRAE